MSLGGDATKYYSKTILGEKRFIKEFEPEYLSQDRIQSYHIIHKYLSKYTKDVYFGDIEIDGKKIENRKINILSLDPKLVFSKKNKKGKDIIITNSEYIEGKTLEDYRDQIGDNIINSICDAITKYIQQLTGIEFTDMYGVTPINIKINIKDGTAYLVVTDISCNIRNLFYTGKNIIKIQELTNKELSETLN
ncbi:hypothetical protein K9M48_02690 [Candidatus Gracilibacteria bacterium]|nr:hypothetical protein [Candidatus Gracilibacteria bacterium]